MLNFVRIIPVTIAAAIILLGVKVGEVWSGVREAVASPPVAASDRGPASVTSAQQTAEAPPATAEEVTAQPASGGAADVDEAARRFVLSAQARSADGTDAQPMRLASAQAQEATTQEAATQGASPEAAQGQASNGAGTAGVPPAPATAGEGGTGAGATAPTEFSQAEIELLQNLSRRRDELDGREQQLELRENLLAATEKRIEERIEELRRIEGQIDALLIKYDEQRERQVESLVRIYQNMKAKDAARIFERLDMNVLLEVAENMNSRALAPILAEMDANRAQKITVELATRRQLPGTN